MNVFKAENVSIGYSNKILFKDLNFEIKTGVLTSLLGSNGIGKSTLLKTISRLLQPISGSLFIDQQPINQLTQVDFSKLVSVVLTNENVNKELTVHELLKLGRQPYTNWLDQLTAEEAEFIEQTLVACEITDLAQR